MPTYIFDYPLELFPLPGYASHAGQMVSVVRPLRHRGDDAEFEFKGEAMFRIRAADGWEGNAMRSELRLTQP